VAARDNELGTARGVSRRPELPPDVVLGFQVHNRLVADLDESKMELVETQSFATEVSSALAKLKERDVRILLGNFNEFWARRIFCEAYRFGLYGRKYQWIIIGTYTRDWWLHPDGDCNIRELSAALHGVILVDLLPLTNEGQHTTSGIVSGTAGGGGLRRFSIEATWIVPG